MELKNQNVSKELKDALNVITEYGLLGVGCCHITGMHNPSHFIDGKGVCDFQMSNAFMLLRHLAGFVEPRPSVAEPCPSRCGWCERYELDRAISTPLQDDEQLEMQKANLRPTLNTMDYLNGLTRT